MRAQVSSDGNKVTIKVCGRLTEEFVPELENCWRQARAEQPGAEILVDLQHVSFIDDKGSSLLERMHHGGARFAAAGLMIRAIVNHILHKEAKP